MKKFKLIDLFKLRKKAEFTKNICINANSVVHFFSEQHEFVINFGDKMENFNEKKMDF